MQTSHQTVGSLYSAMPTGHLNPTAFQSQAISLSSLALLSIGHRRNKSAQLLYHRWKQKRFLHAMESETLLGSASFGSTLIQQPNGPSTSASIIKQPFILVTHTQTTPEPNTLTFDIVILKNAFTTVQRNFGIAHRLTCQPISLPNPFDVTSIYTSCVCSVYTSSRRCVKYILPLSTIRSKSGQCPIFALTLDIPISFDHSIEESPTSSIHLLHILSVPYLDIHATLDSPFILRGNMGHHIFCIHYRVLFSHFTP
jgi:hypothetical protein